MGVGKVHGETERCRKWALKVTMTTLWVAPTQTSRQVLEKNTGTANRGVTNSLAIKTKGKQLTTEEWRP